MTAQFILEIEHFIGQNADGNPAGISRNSGLAYLVILAIDAAHITISKKERTRTAAARYGRLLTPVSANCRYKRLKARAAKAAAVFQTVYTTLMRTNAALFQTLQQTAGPDLQFSILEQVEVNRPVFSHNSTIVPYFEAAWQMLDEGIRRGYDGFIQRSLYITGVTVCLTARSLKEK
jgi:hypothetical protein